jgi:hypothetical protein
MTSSKSTGPQAPQTLFALPIKARWCVPANLGSADCGQTCRCDDGCDYVIKDGKSGGSVPLTPHSEWFCTQLADLIGIASPQCKIIEMGDGSFTFGSRWEGGVVTPSPGGNFQLIALLGAPAGRHGATKWRSSMQPEIIHVTDDAWMVVANGSGNGVCIWGALTSSTTLVGQGQGWRY